MNKKLKISILLCSLVGTNAVFAESAYDSRYGYSSFGVKSLTFDKDSSLESPAFSDQKFVFFDLTYGYHLTKYLSAEASIMLPIEKRTSSVFVDNFRTTEDLNSILERASNGATSDEIAILAENTVQSSRIENEIDAKYIASLGLEFIFPLGNNFEFFANGGFNMVNMDYSFSYNQPDFSFSDNQAIVDPSLFLFGTPTGCQLTGSEELCGTPLQTDEVSLDETGIYYGGGIKFNYSNNTSIVLGYRMSDLDTFEYSGYEVKYEYRF